MGLIASAPCTAFSNAGDREGMRDIPLIYEGAADLLHRRGIRSDLVRAAAAPSSLLVLEPLRWALALSPEWIALEQVPPVVDLWKAYARWLDERGYSTWAGVLNAADYGVPQVRRRAFMLASRTSTVQPPEPTHAEGGGLSLFGELAPWVSMAAALGWGMTERPYATIASARTSGGPDKEKVGGSGAREALYAEQAAGRWAWERPAPTIVATRRSDEGGLVGRQLAEGEGRNVGGKNWPVAVNTGRDWKEGGEREDAQVIPADEPAPTIDGKGRWQKVYGDDWPELRPATTVQGDPRVWAPGHKENSSDPPGKYQQRRGEEAIRVTLEEAATLQGFPPGYPWQGNRSEQFRQVGNAVPPPLAAAVLRTLVERGGTDDRRDT